MEKKKRGRPTIPSNFLLGNRDAWLRLLEECWPEVGWPLLCLRKQRTATMEDIQRALKPLMDKPNGGLAAAFYRDSFEVCNTGDIRANNKILSKLHPRILATQGQRETQDRLCREVDMALKQSEELPITNLKVNEAIQVEVTRRKEDLANISEKLRILEGERDALEKKVLDQESYVYRSELLDFLHSRGRYAVQPLPLANALAGLRQMRWRQSYVRCSKMLNDSEPHLWYRTFATIRRIWKRRATDFGEAPVEFFRNSLLKLPKKSGYVRQFLWENWRDLRLAIEEYWNPRDASESIPYIFTATFVQNFTRTKSSVEQVLAAQEKLIRQ
jgi:hypothetical protein